jgi:hypothetical protein
MTIKYLTWTSLCQGPPDFSHGVTIALYRQMLLFATEVIVKGPYENILEPVHEDERFILSGYYSKIRG